MSTHVVGQPPTGLRIMVGVPTHDQVVSTFTYDLGQMMAFNGVNLCVEGGPVESLNLSFVTGTYIHSARQELAELAVQQGADYLLWLDSDMRFPKDILLRLLRHRENIVGINYSTRGVPPRFVAVKQAHPTEHLVTGPDSTGLEEVEAMGFGAVLMRVDVLRSLRDPRGPEGPWFQCAWDPELRQHVGEDVYFCRLVRDAGYRVLVDHDLSKVCAHVGTFEYRPEHVLAMTEEGEDGAPE